MKRSICSLLLMLIFSFVLQSPILHATNVLAQEYSVEERIYIAEQYINGIPNKNEKYDGNFEPRDNQNIGGAGHLSNHNSQQHHHQLQPQQQPQQHHHSPQIELAGSQNRYHTHHNQQHQQPQTHPQNHHHQQQQQQHYSQEQYYPQPQQQVRYPQTQQQNQAIPAPGQHPHQEPAVSQHMHSSQHVSPLQQTQPQHHYHQQNHNNDLQLEHSQVHHQQVNHLNQNHEQQQLSHSMIESLEQVIVDGQKRQYYARAKIQLRSESIQEGSELYVHNIESHHHHQMEYYGFHQIQQQSENSQPFVQIHHQEQIMYSIDNGDDVEAALQYYHHHESRPSSSCEPIEDPSLMSMNFGQPTCRATSASTMASPGSSDSSGNVPNFSHYNNNKPSHNSNVESFPLAPHNYHYESSLMTAIRHYWREVSGLCLASAIFLNWLFVVVKRKFMATGLSRAEHAIETIQGARSSKSVSKDTNSGSAHDSAFEENGSPLSIDDADSSSQSSSIHNNKSPFGIHQHQHQPQLQQQQLQQSSIETPVMRQRSSTLRAEAISALSTSPNGHTPVSLSNSASSTSEYNSRYSSDFDSIQRLGRGGFGIVFEARNKIDDCHYAVKRICLPLEKEARERVMREVRALAKLDHAGIVRYYNAWLEAPPDEWLKQHDAQLGILHSKDGVSFPSTDGIYDRIESDINTKAYGTNNTNTRLLESGDNSSSLFGKNGPFNSKKRANGFSKFLRNNSSSPSLDIVFEGSGSIRLEAENNNTGETNNSNKRRKAKHRNSKGALLLEHQGDNKRNGDINHSDSEDSDFIQFESKHSNDELSANGVKVNDGERDISASSRLTEPFSSSDSELESEEEDDQEAEGDVFDDNGNDKKIDNNKLSRSNKKVDDGRKRALNQQKQLRQNMNNSTLVDSLHVEKAYLYIQMQLCRKDTLKDWLKTNCETRDKTTIFDLFYQIVDAVEYVHSQDLIHRDLKPSNIFFSLDGTLKIGDFGLCRAKTNAGVGSSLDLQEYVAESDVERGFEAVHTEQVGTQLYMSPEQLNGQSYNQKVDIFAMGLILLELLIPFKTQMQRVNVLFKARNNLYSDEFKTDHPLEHELVKSLLNRSPQKRPTANEIKQNELLASAQLSQPVIERIYHRRRTISSNSSTE